MTDISAALAMLTAAVAAACAQQTPVAAHAPTPQLQTVCAGTGFPAVAVDVRRPDGRPIAPGSKLVVIDGAYRDSVIEGWSPLTLGAAGNRAGVYTVQVTKPYYQPMTIQHVVVPGGACGAFRTVKVSVTLQAVANAPAIRSVSLDAPGVSLGSRYTNHYHTYVDAVPGADTSVAWRMSDPRGGDDRFHRLRHGPLWDQERYPGDCHVACGSDQGRNRTIRGARPGLLLSWPP